MSVTYHRCADLAEVLRCVGELAPRTVVLDVEPLVAYWDTGASALRDGVDKVVGQLVAVPCIELVVFATNSRRDVPVSDPAPYLSVRYLAMAIKPLRTAPYRYLPMPGAFVGDQIATDGVLAWRLGYAFVHYRPDLPRLPLGPRMMSKLGVPLKPLLFR